MRIKSFVLAFSGLVLCSWHFVVYSQIQQPTDDHKAYHVAPHPGLIADAVVTMISDHDYDIHIPSREYRKISGNIIKIEKADFLDGPIVHRAGVMIAPIYREKAMKLFLKKYEDRSGYYLVGVFPAEFPTEPK